MNTNRPNKTDLLEAVGEFLEQRIMPNVDKNTAFYTRVAVNVLGIVEREIKLAPGLETDEQKRISKLLGKDGSLETLNKELCHQIREGMMDYNNNDLMTHLRQTVIGKLSIDNPEYSAYKSEICTDN